MSETWAPIPGFDGYEASDLGRVRSSRQILKPYLSTNGYLIVSLRRHGTSIKVSVHRSVLAAFLGGFKELDARHINGSKTDNRLSNLTWGTRSQNIYDAVRHGTHNNGRKTHCKRGHELTPQNTYLMRPQGTGTAMRRQCVTCAKEANHRRYLERKKVPA